MDRHQPACEIMQPGCRNTRDSNPNLVLCVPMDAPGSAGRHFVHLVPYLMSKLIKLLANRTKTPGGYNAQIENRTFA